MFDRKATSMFGNRQLIFGNSQSIILKMEWEEVDKA